MDCSHIGNFSCSGTNRIRLGYLLEKIGNLPEVKNLTNKAKNEFGSIIGNSTLDIAAFINVV